jgi:hypothetical protein
VVTLASGKTKTMATLALGDKVCAHQLVYKHLEFPSILVQQITSLKVLPLNLLLNWTLRDLMFRWL